MDFLDFLIEFRPQSIITFRGLTALHNECTRKSIPFTSSPFWREFKKRSCENFYKCQGIARVWTEQSCEFVGLLKRSHYMPQFCFLYIGVKIPPFLCVRWAVLWELINTCSRLNGYIKRWVIKHLYKENKIGAYNGIFLVVRRIRNFVPSKLSQFLGT